MLLIRNLQCIRQNNCKTQKKKKNPNSVDKYWIDNYFVLTKGEGVVFVWHGPTPENNVVVSLVDQGREQQAF